MQIERTKTTDKSNRFVIVLDPPRPKEDARVLPDPPPLEPAHIVWALMPIAKDL